MLLFVPHHHLGEASIERHLQLFMRVKAGQCQGLIIFCAFLKRRNAQFLKQRAILVHIGIAGGEQFFTIEN